MRITCPRCEAAYEVPEMMLSSGLSSGRAVRCARCGERWVPLAPPAGEDTAAVAAGPAPATPVPPQPEAVALPPIRVGQVPDRTVSAPAPRGQAPARSTPARSAAAVTLAWLASLAVVAALLVGFVVLRDEVAAAWPPSLRLYRLLGLA